MRLINTTTLVLEEFSEEDMPLYAILSHTWGRQKEEVTFQEMTSRALEVGTRHTIDQKPGFVKIRRFCDIASSYYKLDWAWVDTCCIDKSSSAELSEAINSMYTWYEKAYKCIAFLVDSQGALGDSKWFTRGWTLQELIAPHDLQFRDSDWQMLGDKFELAEGIAARTNIPVSVLRKEKDVSEIPVGERMCWISARKTTRAEDVAYCLLGLFDINMPMLYGEGGVKAFLRLQEEIIKQNTDMSIFAWTAHDMPEIDANFSGLLAISPKCFSACKGLIAKPHVHRNMREFFTSNRGIRFDLYLGRDPDTGCFLLPLSHDSPHQRDLAVYLRPMAPDLFVRAFPNRLATISIIDRQIGFHVMKALSRSQAWKIALAKLKFPDLKTDPDAPFQFVEASPQGSWDPTENVMYAGHTDTFSGILRFYARHQGLGATFIVACDFRESTWRTALLRTFDKDELSTGQLNVMWYRLFDAERARFYGEDDVQEVSMRDRGIRINLCLAFEPAGVARLTCDPESIWLYGGGPRRGSTHLISNSL